MRGEGFEGSIQAAVEGAGVPPVCTSENLMMLPDYPCFLGRVRTLNCGPPESEAIDELTESKATNARQDTGPKSGNGSSGWGRDDEFTGSNSRCSCDVENFKELFSSTLLESLIGTASTP